MDFQGNILKPNTKSYDRANNLYASSTYGKERDMNPGAIYQPTSIVDIQEVVKAANRASPPLPIAIRTGGHQYSGASSTNEKGIQLDLKPTFRRPNLDLKLRRENGKAFVYSSVSWSLMEFYDFLLDNQVFLPTGQCATVCLGGHVQTGGYGMLARSFGLFADYVEELDIVNAAGEVVKVTKQSDPDLFFGFLGGSPGNMGVLTHFKVEVQEDVKHQNSKGLWIAFEYNEKTMKYLLDLLAEKAKDDEFPRNYDFGVNIVSRKSNLLDLFPGSEAELRKILPKPWAEKVVDLAKLKIALIIVYAQWVNFGGEEKFSEKVLFERIKKAPNGSILPPFTRESGPKDGMSKITSGWLFPSDREFPYPYIKRTNTTDSTTLDKDGWPAWFTGRVNELVNDKHNGLYISSQLQVMGGKNSMLWKHANNGTAYSWRKSTLTGTWDVFYEDNQKGAESWQKKNDDGLGHFCKQDRRLLWGSYGDWDMKKVWQFYHEEPVYRRVQQTKKRTDPKGVFTANPFCVEAAQ